MTSAPVSDNSIFLHESVIRGHHISKGYGLQEQKRLYKFDKKQEILMIEMLWLCSKPMKRWLDMCLARSCWVLLDSKAFKRCLGHSNDSILYCVPIVTLSHML